jgi:hypothetical protein
MPSDFLNDISAVIDDQISGKGSANPEKDYLSKFAPNIIQWVTGVEYWNVPTTFQHSRQYQLLRDFFNLRCKNCNSQDLDAIDCWGKGREYLESEVLLEWSDTHQDFVCPKCGNTLSEYVDDGVVDIYNEALIIAGMRSGKSFFGAHMGGYVEHILRVISARGGRNAIPRYLGQALGETFEVSFAASTATQSKDTIYAKYRSMRNGSPWIERAVKYVKDLEAKQVGTTGLWSYRELDNQIRDEYLQVRFNSLSSNSAGVAGKTRIFSAIDELSRLSTSESKTSAQELYRVLNQSLKTVRASVRRLNLPPMFGLMLNVTSPIALDDAAMLLHGKVKNGELKKTFCWKGATWEFNPFLTPDDFIEEYAKDPVGAERDFGANPPNAATPLFDNPLRFWKCVDSLRTPSVTFNTIYRTDTTGKKYIGASVDKLAYNWRDPLYIFCDAGHTFDCFSIVGAHAEYVAEDHYNNNMRVFSGNDVRVPNAGTHITKLPSAVDSPLSQGLSAANSFRTISPTGENLGRLITVVDFVWRIIPSKEREVYFNSIIDIIKSIKEKRKILTVAFDQWQSVNLIQAIRDLGIQSNKVRLRNEDFLIFVQEVYNDKVSFLPPNPMDNLSLSEQGVLQMSTQAEFMYPESVGLIELLTLERSSDLRKIAAPKKGSVRGRGSDDLARCLVGVDSLIKNSVVSKLDSGRRRELVKRLNATGANFQPNLFKPGQPYKKY